MEGTAGFGSLITAAKHTLITVLCRDWRLASCLASEAELPDAAPGMVVPDHHLGSSRGWKHRGKSSTPPCNTPLPQRLVIAICVYGEPFTTGTLLGGYLGDGPPPTSAMMLQRNSISTMPMPPLLNSRRICIPHPISALIRNSIFDKQASGAERFMVHEIPRGYINAGSRRGSSRLQHAREEGGNCQKKL